MSTNPYGATGFAGMIMTGAKPLTEGEVIAAVYGPPYQHGYDDGLNDGKRRGWNEATEAVAEWHERKADELDAQQRERQKMKRYKTAADFRALRGVHTRAAAAIRKLKKP